MKSKINAILILGIIFFLGLLFLYPCKGYTNDSVTRSTLKNRTSVGLTIYNQNFALVQEKRNLALSPTEKQEVIFQDVPIQKNKRLYFKMCLYRLNPILFLYQPKTRN